MGLISDSSSLSNSSSLSVPCSPSRLPAMLPRAPSQPSPSKPASSSISFSPSSSLSSSDSNSASNSGRASNSLSYAMINPPTQSRRTKELSGDPRWVNAMSRVYDGRMNDEDELGVYTRD